MKLYFWLSHNGENATHLTPEIPPVNFILGRLIKRQQKVPKFNLLIFFNDEKFLPRRENKLRPLMHK